MKLRLCNPNIQKLSISMRYLLMFAADGCSLDRIEGRIDVVEDIALAIQNAAKALPGYIRFISGNISL
jgi:hypothetical protein